MIPGFPAVTKMDLFFLFHITYNTHIRRFFTFFYSIFRLAESHLQNPYKVQILEPIWNQAVYIPKFIIIIIHIYSGTVVS